MEHDAQIVVRVPQQTADRLKDYAAGLTVQFGIKVTVAAATRKLLEDALEKAFADGDGDWEVLRRESAPKIARKKAAKRK
jgi:hypothetical protein